MTTTSIQVDKGCIEIAKGTAQFVVADVGSGIGIFAFDPDSEVAGAAHISLPGEGSSEIPGRHTSTAIPMLLSLMQGAGAVISRIKVVIFGGSNTINTSHLADSQINFGERNLKEVRGLLAATGVLSVMEETGGFATRALEFDSETGSVTSLSCGRSTLVCELGEGCE